MIWYMIEGFNGYEINKDGVVRSMKMMNAKPGHHIKLYDEDKDGNPIDPPYYILSNNFNKRVKMTPEELLNIVFHSGLPLKPRKEEAVYMGSRNKHFYFDEGIYPKNNNNQMDFSKFIVEE